MTVTGAPLDFCPIQGRTPVSPRYFPLHILAEQLGDLGRFGITAHAARKLLREVKDIVLTHGHSDELVWFDVFDSVFIFFIDYF
jgi:hypothetical protein